MIFNINDAVCNLAVQPVCITTIVVLVTVIYYAVKHRQVPPGPTGFPYLGYWPFLRETPAHFEQLSKKYGSIFSFTVTGHLYINLSTFKLMREAHVTKAECFASRGRDFNISNLLFADGIFVAEGESWQVLRKYFVQCFKDYGLLSMKSSNTGPLYDSINDIITELHVKKGEPVCIVDMLTDKVMTIIFRALFGDNAISLEKAREINNAYIVAAQISGSSNLLLRGSIAQYVIFPLMSSYRKAVKSHKEVIEAWESIVEDHERSFDENYIRNVIDSFFKERNDRRLKGNPTARYFTRKALVATLNQIVGDGINAVSTFISMFIQTLLEHPEEQKKIYEELLEVLGPERQPAIEDNGRLPYLNGFIYETMRTWDFLPFLPGLECTKETTIQGYRIPKGAITLLNASLAYNDPEVYEDPLVFNPSRFVTTGERKKPEIPSVLFGIGKRSCIGESFSMMQIFLFLGTLIKNFRMTLPDGVSGDKISDVFKMGSWQICAHPRNEK